MSVTKQDNGKWLVQIDRKGLNRVRRSFETRKEAEIFEREYLYGYAPKKAESHDPRTLLELINIWYECHGINLARPETFKREMDNIANDLGNPIGHHISPEMFLKYRFKRTKTNEAPISFKTFNNGHGLLSAMFNRLLKLKVIDYQNPLSDVDKLKIQEKQMSYLSSNQIEQLLSTINEKGRNQSTWWVTNICLRTGARWSEAEQLKFKQLNHGKVTYEITKSKRLRTIPLDDDFYNKLMIFAANKNPNDRIFTDCYEPFDRMIKRSGIELPKGQLTHVLRHSFASHFMMNGGNILTLKKILGHSDIKMTMRYAHLSPNHLKDAVTRNPLANKIGGKLAVE